MSSNIEFENGLYGIKATIKTTWQDSFLQILIDNEVQELILNNAKGWQGDNVDFLQWLPDLKSIAIIDMRLKSIGAVHYLHNLLQIQLITYANQPIDFTSFPELVVCDFEWIRGSDSIFSCTVLKSLCINRYNSKSSETFKVLKNLEKLTLLNSPIENIEGLSALSNLKYLRLANLKKLKSLDGLENLTQLEELKIHSCKGTSVITNIFKLVKLKRLHLLETGTIESIKGIENLFELWDFIFYGSTNILDGDISPVLKLKNLAKISYQNRKHYSHKREDFGKLYG